MTPVYLIGGLFLWGFVFMDPGDDFGSALYGGLLCAAIGAAAWWL